jgi:prophage regulatory protein
MDANDRIIRLPEVLEKIGLKKSAVYNMIKTGEFPAQIKLGKHASGWLLSAVQGWIQKQAGQKSANDDHREAA